MRPEGLSKVSEFRVTPDAVQRTEEILDEGAEQEEERLILWGGHFQEPHTLVCDVVIEPRQRADGLGIFVPGDALEEAMWELHERERTLAAQIHSHPGEAFHSEVDNQFYVSTRLGSLSIVVPYFGQGEIILDRCAIYRLDSQGWRGPLTAVQKEDLIVWGGPADE